MEYLSPQDRIGTRVSDRYRLESIMAHGGMGVLFKARDTQCQRDVAVKLPREPVAKAEDRMAWANLETCATRRFDHPHVVTMLDKGFTEDGSPFVVMELLEGRCLADWLAIRGRLAPKETLTLLLPVMGALSVAHDHGVVHCDVTPANIFLSETPAGILPKLLDFGIAKVQGNNRHAESNRVLGTPQYMSPEQATGADAGPAIDIWSMGVVLYRCLSGRAPFKAQTPEEVVLTASRGEIAFLHDAEPAIGKLSVAVDRALRYRVLRRYTTMRQFARAILMTALMDGIEIPPRPDPLGLPDWQHWHRADMRDTHATTHILPS